MPAKACAVCGTTFYPSPAEYAKERHCSAACRHDIQTRFWSKVNKTDGCWEWTGNKGYGYGHFWIGTKATGRDHLAHRVSYEWAYGPIPAGMDVCHKCDNPACIRPDHLFLGDHATNMRDRTAKRRDNAPKGERNNKARLTWEAVRAIRAAYAVGDVTLKTLATQHGVSVPVVSKVVRGEAWKES